jgi:hypothetical protein
MRTGRQQVRILVVQLVLESAEGAPTPWMTRASLRRACSSLTCLGDDLHEISIGIAQELIPVVVAVVRWLHRVHPAATSSP